MGETACCRQDPGGRLSLRCHRIRQDRAAAPLFAPQKAYMVECRRADRPAIAGIGAAAGRHRGHRRSGTGQHAGRAGGDPPAGREPGRLAADGRAVPAPALAQPDVHELPPDRHPGRGSCPDQGDAGRAVSGVGHPDAPEDLGRYHLSAGRGQPGGFPYSGHGDGTRCPLHARAAGRAGGQLLGLSRPHRLQPVERQHPGSHGKVVCDGQLYHPAGRGTDRGREHPSAAAAGPGDRQPVPDQRRRVHHAAQLPEQYALAVEPHLQPGAAERPVRPRRADLCPLRRYPARPCHVRGQRQPERDPGAAGQQCPAESGRRLLLRAGPVLSGPARGRSARPT